MKRSTLLEVLRTGFLSATVAVFNESRPKSLGVEVSSADGILFTPNKNFERDRPCNPGEYDWRQGSKSLGFLFAEHSKKVRDYPWMSVVEGKPTVFELTRLAER
eukprot:Trichotokara_eunicae@DN11133_c0_g1_i1.p1